MLPEPAPRSKMPGRIAAVVFGLLLLVHLVRRAGAARLLEGIASVGWGLLLVIALAGLLHVVRTWAWHLTLVDAHQRPSFGRMLALRLVSEAAGQVGVLGQVFGDTWRIARLGAELPVADRIASVALDRALFTLSSTVVTIAGITTVAFLLPLPAKVAVYAKVFGIALIALLLLAAIAVRRRWAVLSGPAGALRGLGRVGRLVQRQQEAIRAVEDRVLNFFHHSPVTAWKIFGVQIAGQLLAVLEPYLILRLLGWHAPFSSALAIEGLTKLINVIGLINPGNAGTYEGGTMLLAKAVGIAGTAGLTMGIIRRVRALFWTLVGAICAGMLPGRAEKETAKSEQPARLAGDGHIAVILAQATPADWLLARVGAVPVLLRAILSAQKAGAERIVVVVDGASALRVQEDLRGTRRLPGCVEWRNAEAGDVSPIVRELADCGQRVLIIAGDRIFHPSLHRRAGEWDGLTVLAPATGGEPAGIFAFAAAQANRLFRVWPPAVQTIVGVHNWLTTAGGITCDPVASQLWQAVSCEPDRLSAEGKLNTWLVKPTDGVLARMNRRVSIPISRQLIKLPITPNHVSLFTLAVSFLAGAFFAFGGRWNMLAGAVLSVFASILDGSDGEVARLKLQESAFGCWLDTICDYLYYVFIFAGMMIGLLGRGPVYMVWGSMLFAGALLSFLTTAMQRRRMAGARPEQYLTLWQAQASKRSSNPFLYLGRHTEFLIRRCTMPYLILAFALFGGTYLAFIGAAVGSNIVWPIALYSYFTFKPARVSHD